MKRNKTFKKARKVKGKWSLPFFKKKEETAVVVYKEPSKPYTRVLKRKPKSKAIEVRLPDSRTTISEEPSWAVSVRKKPSKSSVFAFNKRESTPDSKTKDASIQKTSLIQRLLVGGKSKSGSPSYSYGSYSYELKDKKRKKTAGEILGQKALLRRRKAELAERERQAKLEKLRRRTELIQAKKGLFKASKEMRKERILASRYHPATYVTGKVVGKTVSGIMNKLTETPKKPKKRKVTTWW